MRKDASKIYKLLLRNKSNHGLIYPITLLEGDNRAPSICPLAYRYINVLSAVYKFVQGIWKLDFGRFNQVFLNHVRVLGFKYTCRIYTDNKVRLL